MDEPENAAAPTTETRNNPFDAGYRRVWQDCNPEPSIATLFVRGAVYLLALVALALLLVWGGRKP